MLSQNRHANAEVCVQWGPLLLQIIAHWSPKQISSLSGGRLRPNSIVKRVKTARVQAGKIRQQAECAEKGGKVPEKRTRDTDAAPRFREDILYAEHHVIESEASRKLRFSQLEIQSPDWIVS